jgi:hypothetical protein
MKKIFLFFAAILFVYSMYYDLTAGTLPVTTAAGATETTGSIENEKAKAIAYVPKEVQRGDTVLSIEEHIHDGPLPVPIEAMIADFRTLNAGVEPIEIQTGKTYKFPVYQ